MRDTCEPASFKPPTSTESNRAGENLNRVPGIILIFSVPLPVESDWLDQRGAEEYISITSGTSLVGGGDRDDGDDGDGDKEEETVGMCNGTVNVA